jgi:hypothetical protein
MGFTSTPLTVTTALLVAFAAFVIFIYVKNWLDSNIPIMFYVVTIAYMKAVEGTVPFWLSAAGLGLALMLRFEFMNTSFTRFIKFLEICALAAIIYFSAGMIFR